jgi:formate/nitrite transporter FocA (FNT family)
MKLYNLLSKRPILRDGGGVCMYVCMLYTATILHNRIIRVFVVVFGGNLVGVYFVIRQ